MEKVERRDKWRRTRIARPMAGFRGARVQVGFGLFGDGERVSVGVVVGHCG